MMIFGQTKEVIINDYVSIYYDTIPEHCVLCSVSKEGYYCENGILLGVYKSKERCLEILKDITINVSRNNKIYSMPKE